MRVNVPSPGKGGALNAGIVKARGEISAFTDDDCYPRHDFLQQVIRTFEEDPELGFIGGRVLLYDTADAPMTIQTNTNEISIPPRSFIPPCLILGANMAVRREVIGDIGGFDPMLGPGTPFVAEDVEFLARASAAGWKGGYFPGPVVSHHHGRRSEKEVKTLERLYCQGCGAYYAKFLMNRQTRILYAKHCWWQVSWESKAHNLRQIYGALHYCLRRFLALREFVQS